MLLQEMERRRVESGGELDKTELNVFEVELMRLQNKMAEIASEVEEVHTAAKHAEKRLAQKRAEEPVPPQRSFNREAREGSGGGAGGGEGGERKGAASAGAAVGPHQVVRRGDAGMRRAPAVAAPPRTTKAAQPRAVIEQLRGLQIQGLQNDSDADGEVREGPGLC